MFIAVSLALAALSRLTCRFGWEEVSFEDLNDDVYVHQHLTRRACTAIAGGSELPASTSLEWHTDYIDSYLYNPLFWAGGVTSGDGLDRLKVATSFKKELEALHFDELTSVDQVEFMWSRYLSGCLAGLFWAADRDDVAAAHNILGATLHPIQDFYSHSSWVDKPGRRTRAWHEFGPLERSQLGLYTGSYETPDHLSQRPHGKVSFECSIMRMVDVSPLMEIACVGFSPLNKMTPCQVFDRCRDAEAVSTNVLGVQLPKGLVYVDPPGIALDSSWQAEIARQIREIAPDDNVTAQQLYTAAKDLAVSASTWWLSSVGKVMAQDPMTANFWERVLNTNTYGQRHAQFEVFSKVPFLFTATGAYPPAAGTTPWDWYLRLQIRTSEETDSGTNGSVKVSALGQTFLLDYGKDASAVVEYNDFSTGDVQTYMVGPFQTLPTELTFSVEGNDVGDILTVIWEGFVGAIDSAIEALGDFFLSIIGGHADFVALKKLQWSPEQLAAIGPEPVNFREFLDGDDEGQYHVYGSIRRDPGAVTPHGYKEYVVRIDTLECWEESDELSSEDEPFLLAALVNLSERDQHKRVMDFRTSPFSMDDGDTVAINHEWRAVVPDNWGMLALPIAIYESDQETASDRDELLDAFAGRTHEETQSWSDKLIETIGATIGSDWKLGGLEVYAFNRAPVAAQSTYLRMDRDRPIEEWVEAGSSFTVPLDTGTPRRTWSLPDAYIKDSLALFSKLAYVPFNAGRYDEAAGIIRDGAEKFRQLHEQHPEIPLADLVTATSEWHGTATAAHPHDIPRQVPAAANAWEIGRVVANRMLANPAPLDSDLGAMALQLRRIGSFMTFGTPDSSRGAEAVALAREVYWRMGGDHRIDVAGTWADLAGQQHLTAHHRDQPDAQAELARQRDSASQSIAILTPIVEQLPAGDFTPEQLGQMASMLARLMGFVTFGAPVSDASVAAGALARKVYGVLPGDHRVDIAKVWGDLAQRHHLTAFHPQQADQAGELLKQRTAGAEAMAILEPIAFAQLDKATVALAAGVLYSLIGSLSFGGVDSAPSVKAAALAQTAYKLLPGDHRVDIGLVDATLSLRRHEISAAAACPDPAAEQRGQREAAERAARLLVPIAESIPNEAVPPADVRRLADTLPRLAGLITFGLPAGDPRTAELTALSTRTTAAAEHAKAALG